MTAQMTPAQARIIDPVLTGLSTGYRMPGLVGDALFPRVPVAQRGGRYPTFDKRGFRAYRIRRAPGGRVDQVDVGYGSNPYSIAQRTIEGKVPEELLEEGQTTLGINLQMVGTRQAQQIVQLELERDQASIALNAALYDANHKLTLAGATRWSQTGSDPVGNVNDAREAIRASIGIYPNVLTLSAKAATVLTEHAQMVDRIKYTSSNAVTPELMARLFQVDRVVVAGAVTAAEDETLSDVWGDEAVLAYVPTNPVSMMEPSYGYTFGLRGRPYASPSYYSNEFRSWLSPFTDEYDVHQVGQGAGFLFIDAGNG